MIRNAHTLLILTVLSFILLPFQLTSQNRPPVTIQDLEISSDTIFKDANASLLINEYTTVIGQYYEIYRRVKIYNQKGYQYATVTMPEVVSNFEAATYNLENGEVVKRLVSEDALFDEDTEKGYSIKKLTFPNISPGVILEYSYRGYRNTRDDIYLQMAIPTGKLNIEIQNPSDYHFTILQNPRAYIKLNNTTKRSTMWLSAENIPAFEAETYVYDPEMYRAKISFQLKRAYQSDWLGSWNKIARRLNKIDEFSEALEPQKIYRNQLNELLKSEKDELTKTRLIYDLVKDTYEWDEYLGFFPDQGTIQTYWNKKGTLADINLLFISMLRSVDIDAYPVLAATRKLGVPVAPAPEAFNYLFAGVKIDDEIYLLDPANPEALFNRLSPALLNWKGMLIKKGGGMEWIDLTQPEVSTLSMITKWEMTSDFHILGESRQKSTGYFAHLEETFLDEYGDSNKDKLISYDYPGMEVSAIEILEQQEGLVQLSFNFEIENAVESIGDKIYIPPLFFAAMFENPFKQDFRKHPIDFSFPHQIQNLISVQIPEAYEIDFLPDPIKIVLPDDAGFFSYQISKVNNVLQIQTVFQMNEVELPASTFYDVKEFFKLRLDKEKEKVVLKKI